MKFDADGKIAQCGAADSTSALILGIAQRGGSAGDSIDVLVHGVSRAKLGLIAAFENSADCLLTAAASGKLDSATSGDYVVARVLQISIQPLQLIMTKHKFCLLVHQSLLLNLKGFKKWLHHIVIDIR